MRPAADRPRHPPGHHRFRPACRHPRQRDHAIRINRGSRAASAQDDLAPRDRQHQRQNGAEGRHREPAPPDPRRPPVTPMTACVPKAWLMPSISSLALAGAEARAGAEDDAAFQEHRAAWWHGAARRSGFMRGMPATGASDGLDAGKGRGGTRCAGTPQRRVSAGRYPSARSGSGPSGRGTADPPRVHPAVAYRPSAAAARVLPRSGSGR